MLTKFAGHVSTTIKSAICSLSPSSRANTNGAMAQTLLITIIYLVLGCAWVIITDVITSAKYGESSAVLDVNIMNGIIFVAVSTALIFLLIYPTLKKLVTLKGSLQLANSRLGDLIVDLRVESLKSNAVEKALIATQRHAHIGSFDYELSSGHLMCSDETLRICGIQREAFFETLAELEKTINPDDSEMGFQLYKRAIAENRAMEYDFRITNPYVENQVICARFAPVFDDANNCIRVLGTVHDITERRKAELAVIKERNRAQMYLDVAGVIFIGIDENAIVTLINNAGCKLLCYPKEEILGKSWTDNFVIGSCKVKFQSAHDTLRNGNDVDFVNYETSVITGCGEERTISWRLVSIHDDQGNYNGILASGIDITEQQRALKALRESERSKSVLLSHLPGMAYRCSYNQEWTMKFLSDGCHKLTGYWPESFINNLDLSYNDIICPDYRDDLWDDITRSVEKKASYRFKYELTPATGDKKWVLELGQGVFDDEGVLEALEGIVIDITELKQELHSISNI